MVPRSVESEFERLYVYPLKGRTLIVGSHVYTGREDRRKLFDFAEGWDALPGEGVDFVVDMEEQVPEVEQFSHVECVSVLEHCRRPWLVAKNIERLLRVGGTLHLTVPFVWRVHAYPDDFWRFTVAGVRSLFKDIEWVSLLYAHQKLTNSEKSPSISFDEHPYLARSQVCGFGMRI